MLEVSVRGWKDCAPLGVKATFKPMKTMRQTLMKVIPEEKRRTVVYEVPCEDCNKPTLERGKGH